MDSVPEQYLEPLQRAARLAEEFATEAEEVERRSDPPRHHLERVAEEGLLRLGLDAPASVTRRLLELLASGSGVSCFVLEQHQAVCTLVARGPAALRDRFLKKLVTGRLWAGVAIAHWRLAGPPRVTAVPDQGGFRLRGEAPWFTGWGLMEECLVAAALPSGEMAFLMVPLAQVQASAPLELCAMNASATVALRFDGEVIAAERLLRTATLEELAQHDFSTIVRHTGSSLGVVRASVRLLEQLHRQRPHPEFEASAAALGQAAGDIRQAADAWDERPDEKLAIELRARAVELGVRAALSAVVATGGAANSLGHPAQRLYREAMFYGLTQLTGDLKWETLRRLRA